MREGLLILFFFCFSAAYAQQLNPNWQKDLSRDLEQFKTCEGKTSTGINPCSKYVGAALLTVYKHNDFYAKALGRHMLVNEISQHLQHDAKWKLLGRGLEQKALIEAQKLANAGIAVVAVYVNAEGIGHLSLILPGELKPSGTWGFQVPNSASFFTTDPPKSYVGKGLSYAYERPLIKDVLLYARTN